ncbi:hypothetical protein J7L48_02065, partial [bacterium]|nr:hypothetical protein [bacterium]
EYYITDTTGKEIKDERPVYPVIPKTIEIPTFLKKDLDKKRNNKKNGKVILNHRYIVKSAIAHKNSGGIYKAIDMSNNEIVIIKEARPFTNMNPNKVDSVVLLKGEKKILDLLNNSKVAPKQIDYFKEWENYYLVEEYIKGITLTRYRALDYLWLINSQALTESQITGINMRILKLSLKIMKALQIIHDNGIVIGDLSPNNIIINTENEQIKFIDFESSYIIGSKRWVNFYTPGFASTNRGNNRMPKVEDDYYSLGSVILSLILPINNNIYTFNKKKMFLFLQKFVDRGYIKDYIYSLIVNLLDEENYNTNTIKNEIKKIEEIVDESIKLKFLLPRR